MTALSWRREDYGYAAAAAAAVAFVAYLVAVNFGLVPSPLGTPRADGEPPPAVAVGGAAAPATENGTEVLVEIAAPVPAPAGPGAAIAPPAPGRGIPEVAIDTSSGISVSVAQPAYVAGTAFDATSPIDRVVVTFSSGTQTSTVPADLDCDPSGLRCSWRAQVPSVLAQWQVSAQAVNSDGTWGDPRSISITTVNTGAPVDGVVSVVESVPLLGPVVTGLLNVIGLR